MFSKLSRYRKLSNIVTVDVRGRELESKILRLLPEVSGDFSHTMEARDRLDHLAYKYYKQPVKWWRICDANPEFMSPQALLGKEPVVTSQFSLSFDGMSPPWAALQRALSEKIGVESWQIVEEVQLVRELRSVNGQQVTVNAEHYNRAVIVTYNRMNVTAGELADSMADAGFEAGQPEHIGRTGKKITIPKDVVT